MNIDWMALGSIIQGIGTLFGALMVYCTAQNGLSAWKTQRLAERNRDQAEVILHATYSARRALQYIRSPFMSNGEMDVSAKQRDILEPTWRDEHSKEMQNRIIVSNVYFIRIEQHSNARSRLLDCQPMARALFGEELEKAIQMLEKQFHAVRLYADAHIRDRDERDQEFTSKIRHALYDFGEPDGNEVSAAIAASVKTIEQICVPYLRLQSFRSKP